MAENISDSYVNENHNPIEGDNIDTLVKVSNSNIRESMLVSSKRKSSHRLSTKLFGLHKGSMDTSEERAPPLLPGDSNFDSEFPRGRPLHLNRRTINENINSLLLYDSFEINQGSKNIHEEEFMLKLVDDKHFQLQMLEQNEIGSGQFLTFSKAEREKFRQSLDFFTSSSSKTI